MRCCSIMKLMVSERSTSASDGRRRQGCHSCTRSGRDGRTLSRRPTRRSFSRRAARDSSTSTTFRATTSPKTLKGRRSAAVIYAIIFPTFSARRNSRGSRRSIGTPRNWPSSRPSTGSCASIMRTTRELASRIHAGERVTGDEALELYRQAPTSLLGRLADTVRARKHPQPIVTYIIDRNVNYTNVCVAKCNFCAFYRPVGSAEGYVLGFDELFRKIDETIEVGGVQLLLQGGHNPDLPLSWYEDLFRAIKARYPSFKLHALSPPEII